MFLGNGLPLKSFMEQARPWEYGPGYLKAKEEREEIRDLWHAKSFTRFISEM